MSELSQDVIGNVITSLDKLRAKGVTAIKVELEAQLGRFGGGSESCDYCDEDGEQRCPDCDGEGSYDTDNESGETVSVDCETCDSRGYITCQHCGGGNQSSNLRSDEEVLDWMLADIAERTATEQTNSRTTYSNYVYNPFNWMTYAKFYNDQSVDSEITFTVPIDSVDGVFNLPKVIDSFNALAEEIGNGKVTTGAGMHMALLFSNDCTYPHEEDNCTRAQNSFSNRLHAAKLRNFKRAMTQLMPALYFLGSRDDTSRGIGYRLPRVSVDYKSDHSEFNRLRYQDDNGWYTSNPKYSAISYRHGAMEFRVFDTCYDDPNHIFDNIAVMANSVRYLSKTYINPGLSRVADEIYFGIDGNDELKRFYKTTLHIDALNIGLQRLKPAYKSIGTLKEERNFTITKRTAMKQSDYAKDAERQYEEYSERFDIIANIYREEIHSRVVRNYIETSNSLPTSESVEEFRNSQATAARVEQEVNGRYGEKSNKQSYMQEAIRKLKRDAEGKYELNLN